MCSYTLGLSLTGLGFGATTLTPLGNRAGRSTSVCNGFNHWSGHPLRSLDGFLLHPSLLNGISQGSRNIFTANLFSSLRPMKLDKKGRISDDHVGFQILKLHQELLYTINFFQLVKFLYYILYPQFTKSNTQCSVHSAHVTTPLL